MRRQIVQAYIGDPPAQRVSDVGCNNQGSDEVAVQMADYKANHTDAQWDAYVQNSKGHRIDCALGTIGLVDNEVFPPDKYKRK